MVEANTSLFSGRYTLTRRLHATSGYELWQGRDSFGGPMLIKIWPFSTSKPPDEERALWNAELRHLFRLASLPKSDEHLVVLKDAGIEKDHHCFVMAMMAPGLQPLQDLLLNRAKCDWLRNAANESVRADLWRGVRRLARGLIQIHDQQMLHRAIDGLAVFVDREEGPSSMRLGGFEWTVRLGGTPPTGVTPIRPPEGTYSFESDWFLLGITAAWIIASADPASDVQVTIDRIRGQGFLNGNERELLEGLLSTDVASRLSRGFDIVQRIDDIIVTLDELQKLRPEDYLALLVLLGPQRSLTQAIIEEDNSINALEIERQREFVEKDLVQPRIIRKQSTSRETYILIGNRLRYTVTAYSHDESPGTWDLAYCGMPTELRFAGEDEQTTLDRAPIKAFTMSSLWNHENVVRASAISWKPYLPGISDRNIKRDNLEPFHDFFRVTNQLELLMRDAEIFAYTILERRTADGAEYVTLREVSRERPVPFFARLADGMAGFLAREREDKGDGGLVYLGDEEALDVSREVPLSEFWPIIDINSDSGVVYLRRPALNSNRPPPQTGFLRGFGMFGQMSLIKRRKKAIEKMESHAYLLRALQKPDFAFLDTGERQLPREVDDDKIDKAKQSAMRSIWRTRPIFALQGPPGTGKTTLVANLLSQIFEDDNVAQVLVTAQAHAAVDVLRETVAKAIGDDRKRPLAIRFRKTKGEQAPDPDYVEQVTKRLLDHVVVELNAERARTALQSRWLTLAKEAIRALATMTSNAGGDGNGASHGGPTQDLFELVKRAASITYCTTTAGNLAELADTTQTFDWSIIEEAGKAHGFDLALPLQTGHRWLLIGDQKQLPPYRFGDFQNALGHLDAAFAAISDLPGRAGGQADLDLVARWNRYDDGEKSERRQLWLQWLKFFDNLYDSCLRAKKPNDVIEDPDPPGPPVLAERLWQQHRMHPTIATLVSNAYYSGEIVSMTKEPDGSPQIRLRHPFVAPPVIEGKAIVWLDVPWVGSGGRGESGPEQRGGRYTSNDEVDAIENFLHMLQGAEDNSLTLAVLSPYRRQVSELNRRLRDSVPRWMRRERTESRGERVSPTATVDSFQGNQADVVIVSLVRNNEKPGQRGLGFLKEAPRMNVLFSRAEQLLVLVGSWEFFQRKVRDVPADATQPFGHWRIAVDYLETCFASGAAVRIAASDLTAAL